MRDDALSGGHHVIQRKVRQYFCEALAVEPGFRFSVNEINMTGLVHELGDHGQLTVHVQLIAVKFVVAHRGDASSERLCQ